MRNKIKINQLIFKKNRTINQVNQKSKIKKQKQNKTKQKKKKKKKKKKLHKSKIIYQSFPFNYFIKLLTFDIKY